MRAAFFMTLFAMPVIAHSQQNRPIVTGDGWEAFPGVEYQGGDARFPKKLVGVLVLTDSTLEFRSCDNNYCEAYKDRDVWGKKTYFVIPLTAITALDVSSSVRSADVGSKIFFGALASDRKQEFFGLAHETEDSAEAPVFLTRQTQAGAIEAKVRFRLKKLGRPLTPTVDSLPDR